MSLVDPTLYLVLSVGVFAGALVSGLVGFAFSAVAGAILLHFLPPIEAVPLMMACSVPVQAASLVALRGHMRWRGSLMLTLGGVLGVVPALYLLRHVDPRLFQVGFGAFLALYAACMLLRPAVAAMRESHSGLREALIGFGGGLVGGLTAMPGALPMIWCDLRGMPKEQQRGLVQPYIVAVQMIALVLMFSRTGIATTALLDLTLSLLPALAAGTTLGIVMFGRVDGARFRKVVLVVLMGAGLLLFL